MRRLGRRGIAVLLAVLLAVVAAFALLSYVRGVESEALADVEQVEVFVARDRVPAGTPVENAGEQGLIARQAVARKLAPPGAVGSLEEVSGRVAAVDILPGETLVAGRFVAPSQASGVFEIPEDRQAMSIEVGVPPGVAGFIDAGDTVSVIASIEVTPDEPHVEYLVQNLHVLAVGQRVVMTEDGEPVDSEATGGATGDDVRQSEERVLMTLEVSPDEAERLAYAVLHGDVYVTLVPQDQAAASTPGRERSTVFE